MPRAVSTAISDLVLAFSALHAAMKLLSIAPLASVGFTIIAIAATFGTVRFGLSNPHPDVLGWHKYFSWLSTVLGLSLIASAYHRQQNISMIANAHLASGLALTLLGPYLGSDAKAKATEGISTTAVLSVIVLSLVQFNVVALIGGGLYAVSGLVIGAEGTWHSIPRVDLFHYALVIGNIGLMMGLNAQETLVYYREKY